MSNRTKVFELILEIGHRSTPLNKKLANGYTHKWTAFVRGVNNSKIEHCIQRVVFQLHESFGNPHRDISEPPYQIKETGYAGFEIPIEIYFKNKEKNNHIVVVHDLCLLTNKANDSSKTEKVKFINPTREFEKCLIKSGAQLLNVTVKKERSNSPPVKKHKSSSLIPSKDMSKQPQSSQSHHHQSKSSTQHNRNSHHKDDNGSSITVSNNLPSSKQHQQSSKSSSQLARNLYNNPTHHDTATSSTVSTSNNLTTTKQHQQHHQQPEQPRDFLDVFGAPLIYNNKPDGKPEGKPDTKFDVKPEFKLDVRSETKLDVKSECRHDGKHDGKHDAKNDVKPEGKLEAKIEMKFEGKHENKIEARSERKNDGKAEGKKTKDNHAVTNLQLVQNRISCLTDCDRLQKIVDIVEEAGEWFNLTPKKFEFDLKRLDKRTLSKIERCLQL